MRKRSIFISFFSHKYASLLKITKTDLLGYSIKPFKNRRNVISYVYLTLISMVTVANANTVFDRATQSDIFVRGLLPPVQCYSCMSESYEPYWMDMSNVYKKQDLITNRCNDPFFSRGIPYVNCSNICVIMKETISFGGIRVATAYIRGCLDKILSNFRFNETALLTYNFYRKDHCRELPRSMLIGPQFSGNVWFCACYGNRCNAAASGRRLGHAGEGILYLLEFITKIDRFTFAIDDRVRSWLILMSSTLLHFSFAVLSKWILL